MGHYESLRQRALSGPCPAQASAGYGLLVHRGMLAWMRAWAARTPPEEPVPVAPPLSSAPTGALLVPGVEAELVEVLTALVLSSQQQQTNSNGEAP